MLIFYFSIDSPCIISFISSMIGKIYSCDDGFPHLIAEEKGEIQEILEKWKDKCVIEIFDEDTNKRLMIYVSYLQEN